MATRPTRRDQISGPRYSRSSGFPSPVKGSCKTSRTMSRTRTAFLLSFLIQNWRSLSNSGRKASSRLFATIGHPVAQLLDILDSHQSPDLALERFGVRFEESNSVPWGSQEVGRLKEAGRLVH